jgi:hypothetical protein
MTGGRVILKKNKIVKQKSTHVSENILSHAKISRGFVKNRLKITSETKEWQKIILKPR